MISTKEAVKILQRKLDKENRDPQPTWLLPGEREAIQYAITAMEHPELKHLKEKVK